MSDRTPEQRAADRREIEKLHPGERFQLMLDASDTPEVDAVKRELCLRSKVDSDLPMDWNWVVPAEFAGQLERERDEARKSLYTVREALCDALPGSNHPTLVLVFMLTAERGKWKTEAIVAEQQSREALHECDQLRARVAELEGALTTAADEVEGLILESQGVYGLHLNGDPSPWGELEEGGRFERISFPRIARELLAKKA